MDLGASLKGNEEAAALKCTGGHQWVECRVTGVRMEKNTVAKPLALIKTTIFIFFLRT